MRKSGAILLSLLVFCIIGVAAVSAQEDDVTPEPLEDGVAVTVYNQGTALIRDRRAFDLDAGLNTVNFTDVASRIDATSVSFVSLTDPQGTVVLEQNYVYDLVSSSALLRRYVDQTITVTTTDDNTYSGQLLSSGDGSLILGQDDGQVLIVRMDSVRDIRFPELPESLITRPTLRWLVQSAMTGSQQVELTYLTGGLNWTADYNLLLATDNRSLDLNGWITLENSSGTSYADAQLKLVAGDISRLPEPEMRALMMDDMAVAEAAMPAPPSVEQREFFEYKLYEITRPVTVGNNETKQVEFVSSAALPATTFYVYDGSMPFYGYGRQIIDPGYGQRGYTSVQNYLEFTTDDDNGDGPALPAGRVRVYQEDVDGAALLIGENRIEHTPRGETLTIYLGNAFDLVGERDQVDFNRIAENVIQETFEIRLRNRKESETVEIRVPERLVRWSNWEILNASMEYEQINAHTIEFRPQVAPGEEVVITYTVQYSWPR